METLTKLGHWGRRLFTRAFWLNPGSLLVASLLAVLALYFINVHILELIELKTYDLRFLSRGAQPPSPAVAMVVIDEKSLETEGRWPWPRSKMAAHVDVLSREGAKVIGFDIIFAEPDQNSELTFIGRLATKLDTIGVKDSRLGEFLTEQRRSADTDRALLDALKRSKAAIVLGFFFHDKSTLENELEPEEVQRRLKRIEGSQYPHIYQT